MKPLNPRGYEGGGLCVPETVRAAVCRDKTLEQRDVDASWSLSDRAAYTLENAVAAGAN